MGILSHAQHYSIVYPYDSLSGLYRIRIVRNFLIQDTSVYLVDATFCLPLLKTSCSVVTQVSLEDGSLNRSLLIEDFNIGNEEIILPYKDSFIIAGFEHKIDGKIVVDNARVANDLSGYTVQRIDGKDFNNSRFSGLIRTNGMLSFKNRIYSYGNALTSGADSIISVVIQWDSTMQHPIQTWIYKQADLGNHCHDLQPTPSGHLAFLNNSIPAKGQGYAYYNYINEIDTTGKIVYQYIYYTNGNPDGSDDYYLGYIREPVSFVVLDDGDFVFYHRESTLTNDFLDFYISRVDRETKKILWDYKLPEETNRQTRLYTISDMLVAQNGDILLSGSVDFTGYTPKAISGNHAFIARVAPNGKEQWIRYYNIAYPPKDTAKIGYFKRAYIMQIKELPGGDIMGAGFFKTYFKQVRGRSYTENWLLRVGPNGCLTDEDCGRELILLDTKKVPLRYPEVHRLSISPNPIAEGAPVFIPQDISFDRYTLYDLNGKNVRRAETSNHRLSTVGLSKGAYILLLQNKTDLYQAKLFIQ